MPPDLLPQSPSPPSSLGRDGFLVFGLRSGVAVVGWSPRPDDDARPIRMLIALRPGAGRRVRRGLTPPLRVGRAQLIRRPDVASPVARAAISHAVIVVIQIPRLVAENRLRATRAHMQPQPHLTI